MDKITDRRKAETETYNILVSGDCFFIEDDYGNGKQYFMKMEDKNSVNLFDGSIAEFAPFKDVYPIKTELIVG